MEDQNVGKPEDMNQAGMPPVRPEDMKPEGEAPAAPAEGEAAM